MGNPLETLDGGGAVADANMGEEQLRCNPPELTGGLVAIPNVFWVRL